jgi:hypothetical protein
MSEVFITNDDLVSDMPVCGMDEFHVRGTQYTGATCHFSETDGLKVIKLGTLRDTVTGIYNSKTGKLDRVHLDNQHEPEFLQDLGQREATASSLSKNARGQQELRLSQLTNPKVAEDGSLEGSSATLTIFKPIILGRDAARARQQNTIVTSSVLDAFSPRK